MSCTNAASIPTRSIIPPYRSKMPVSAWAFQQGMKSANWMKCSTYGRTSNENTSYEISRHLPQLQPGTGAAKSGTAATAKAVARTGHQYGHAEACLEHQSRFFNALVHLRRPISRLTTTDHRLGDHKTTL